MKRQVCIVVVLFLFAGLGACSRGGGSNNTTTPVDKVNNGNWDQMTWDRDNWS